ncbi:MAG: DUF952 domain-containing protein [Pyrinomonadaceae bacterium]
MLIYHIILPEVWNALDSNAEYTAQSLATEGFIHCSYAHQLDTVLGRYYGGVKKVIVLEIDAERLSSRLVEEPSTNNEIYPHIYGPINTDAIVKISTKVI